MLPSARSDDDALTMLAPSPSEAGGEDAARLASPPAPALDQGATMVAPSPVGTDADGATVVASTANAACVDALPPSPARSSSPPPVAASSTGPLAIGQEFGRYTIVGLLGIGGMGAVYKAFDQELEVVVALKVIRPEAMRDPAAEQEIERRFKRELLLARQVTHRNVVRIYDLGELHGIKYITMSFVRGTDLAVLVRQEGPMPVPKILRIMRSVVDGLVAAHAAGVVHRDLKPANIMLDAGGEAVIMDFGIARSTSGPAPAVPLELAASGLPGDVLDSTFLSSQATMAGTIVGTVEYMAPEQVRGEAVDQRVDVYAAGLILYDLLTGRARAKHAKSAMAELYARMEQPPPSVKSLAPEVPDSLAAVVARAVEPDPGKRYQTTTELAAALAQLDENGEPLPIRRVVGTRILAAVVVLAAALLGGSWWYARTLIPPAPHDPVSVVIADFDNRTDDPTFNGALEPMLKRALEQAGFISAYDRNGIRTALGVRPPEKLDEGAARDLAVKQGLGVVLSGSIDRRGAGYTVTVKATETVTGKAITTANRRASTQAEVLGAATNLMAAVRKSLGDETSDSAQMFAMQSVSAPPEVVRYYAAGREASSNGKFDEARQNYVKAVELDPKFGIGYQALAGLSMNRGNLQDAEKYIKEALRYVDGMTERERYTTRGMFYTMTGDYQQCVKEYSDLVARYPVEVLARNNLALCSTYVRDLPKALEEMRRVVEILPKRALFRVNLALYASYAGDFQTGEREARVLQELGSTEFAMWALAFAQTGQGQAQQAAETYQSLVKVSESGASHAASGLGDLATYEGRFSDAVSIFQQGAAADLAAKNPDKAAAKYAALAYAHLEAGRRPQAVAAATEVLANGKAAKFRFLAARILAEAGEIERARSLVAGLAAELQAEPQAYAKIVEGVIAMKSGDPRQAIKVLTEASGLLDTWIGHLDLGRAFLDAGQFPQADSEFDRCIKRRGEALALFLDEEPTYAYFPLVYYYQGRVREGLNSAGFADSYRQYLTVRGQSKEDPLLPEVRRRAESR